MTSPDEDHANEEAAIRQYPYISPGIDTEAAAAVRTFASGANRDVDGDKIDPEAALSPRVLRAYCEYVQGKTALADGTTRAADNWQKGIPIDSYMKSMMRHVLDVWLNHRNGPGNVDQKEALCALLFNVHGYLHVLLEEKE